MNPAGPLHDGLLLYLTNWSVLVASQRSILVTSQTGLDLAGLESRPEPDLMWVRAADYRQRHPTAADVELAVEVADSSLQRDLKEKAALYAEAGIVEYWIVDANASCVHVFRYPKGTEYTDQLVAHCGDRISPLIMEDAVLDVSELFGTISNS